MTSITTKPDSSQLEAETAPHLFDNWFDPIETEVQIVEHGIPHEDVLDSPAGRILKLPVDGQAPKALQVPAHLLERRRKCQFDVFLHHLPNLGTRDFYCRDRRIGRNDIPKVVHRDRSRRYRCAVPPAIGKRYVGPGGLGNGGKQYVIHWCKQICIAMQADGCLADNFVQHGAMGAHFADCEQRFRAIVSKQFT